MLAELYTEKWRINKYYSFQLRVPHLYQNLDFVQKIFVFFQLLLPSQTFWSLILLSVLEQNLNNKFGFITCFPCFTSQLWTTKYTSNSPPPRATPFTIQLGCFGDLEKLKKKKMVNLLEKARLLIDAKFCGNQNQFSK